MAQIRNSAAGPYRQALRRGPQRSAALSLNGLGVLTRHGLWPVAMRRVIGLKAHERAQSWFLAVSYADLTHSTLTGAIATRFRRSPSRTVRTGGALHRS
jgi:hypothetical protein